MSLDILNSADRKVLDTLYLVLLDLGQQSLLPELLEVFGKETLIKFLDVFAGVTVQVPPAEEIKRAVRDTNIYVTLSQAQNRAEALKSLELEHSLDERSIRRIEAKIDSLVKARQELQKLVSSM